MNILQITDVALTTAIDSTAMATADVAQMNYWEMEKKRWSMDYDSTFNPFYYGSLHFHRKICSYKKSFKRRQNLYG